MPWCPKCKCEYREGFTICADCGSLLVEEEPEAAPKKTSLFLSEEDLDVLNAVKDMRTCPPEEQTRETADERRISRGYSRYQDSSQRADENRSSAWILLAAGSLGLVAVILGVAEVLPFKLGNPYLFYGVMSSVFVLFVVAGVISMKNARVFARKAESENSLRGVMLDWCRKNLNAEEIDNEVSDEGLTDEVLYFSRTAYIKERLNHQFINLDQDFLDRFVDDQVYEIVFEEAEGGEAEG